MRFFLLEINMLKVQNIYDDYIWPRLDTLNEENRTVSRVKVPPNNQVHEIYEEMRHKIQDKVNFLHDKFNGRPFWAVCNTSNSMENLYDILQSDIISSLLVIDETRNLLLQFQQELMETLQPVSGHSQLILDLPTEMIEMILRFLSFPDIIRFGLTCVPIYDIVIENSNIWRGLCQNNNLKPENFALGRMCSSDSSIWLELYTRNWLGMLPGFRGNPCSICRKFPAVPHLRKWQSVGSNAILRWKLCEWCQQMMLVSHEKIKYCGLGLTPRILRKYKELHKKIDYCKDANQHIFYFFEDLLEIALSE